MQSSFVNPAQLLLSYLDGEHRKIGQDISSNQFSQELSAQQSRLASSPDLTAPNSLTVDNSNGNTIASAANAARKLSEAAQNRPSTSNEAGRATLQNAQALTQTSENSTGSGGEVYFSNSPLLEKVAAQLKLPAEARKAIKAAEDCRGRVSLKTLNQILADYQPVSNSSSETKVPSQDVQSLLASMQSGNSETNIAASAAAGAKQQGSYSLSEFRGLVENIARQSLSTESKNGKSSSTGSGKLTGVTTSTTSSSGTTSSSAATGATAAECRPSTVIPSFVQDDTVQTRNGQTAAEDVPPKETVKSQEADREAVRATRRSELSDKYSNCMTVETDSTVQAAQIAADEDTSAETAGSLRKSAPQVPIPGRSTSEPDSDAAGTPDTTFATAQSATIQAASAASMMAAPQAAPQVAAQSNPQDGPSRQAAAAGVGADNSAASKTPGERKASSSMASAETGTASTGTPSGTSIPPAPQTGESALQAGADGQEGSPQPAFAQTASLSDTTDSNPFLWTLTSARQNTASVSPSGQQVKASSLADSPLIREEIAKDGTVTGEIGVGEADDQPASGTSQEKVALGVSSNQTVPSAPTESTGSGPGGLRSTASSRDATGMNGGSSPLTFRQDSETGATEAADTALADERSASTKSAGLAGLAADLKPADNAVTRDPIRVVSETMPKTDSDSRKSAMNETVSETTAGTKSEAVADTTARAGNNNASRTGTKTTNNPTAQVSNGVVSETTPNTGPRVDTGVSAKAGPEMASNTNTGTVENAAADTALKTGSDTRAVYSTMDAPEAPTSKPSSAGDSQMTSTDTTEAAGTARTAANAEVTSLRSRVDAGAGSESNAAAQAATRISSDAASASSFDTSDILFGSLLRTSSFSVTTPLTENVDPMVAAACNTSTHIASGSSINTGFDTADILFNTMYRTASFDDAGQILGLGTANQNGSKLTGSTVAESALMDSSSVAAGLRSFGYYALQSDGFKPAGKTRVSETGSGTSPATVAGANQSKSAVTVGTGTESFSGLQAPSQNASPVIDAAAFCSTSDGNLPSSTSSNSSEEYPNSTLDGSNRIVSEDKPVESRHQSMESRREAVQIGGHDASEPVFDRQDIVTNQSQDALAGAGNVKSTTSATATLRTSGQGSLNLGGSSWPSELAERIQAMYQQKRTSNLTLDLEPEGMGHLTLRVSARKQEVAAYVSADNVQVGDLLSRNSAVLKENLQSQGLTLTNLFVDVRQGSDGNAGSLFQNGNSRGQESRTTGTRRGESSQKTSSRPVHMIASSEHIINLVA